MSLLRPCPNAQCIWKKRLFLCVLAFRLHTNCVLGNWKLLKNSFQRQGFQKLHLCVDIQTGKTETEKTGCRDNIEMGLVLPEDWSHVSAVKTSCTFYYVADEGTSGVTANACRSRQVVFTIVRKVFEAILSNWSLCIYSLMSPSPSRGACCFDMLMTAFCIFMWTNIFLKQCLWLRRPQRLFPGPVF